MLEVKPDETAKWRKVEPRAELYTAEDPQQSRSVLEELSTPTLRMISVPREEFQPGNSTKQDKAFLEKHQIDRQQAIAQLKALGHEEGDVICFRFFFPEKDPRKADDEGRKVSGVFPNLPWQAIETYQKEGRGAYIVVNSGGHSDKEITQGLAIFCEWDDRGKEEQINLWRTLGLPEPTLQVDTGGKSIHNYWVLDQPCSQQEWRKLQIDLLEYLDGDRKLKNPSRVMRLAGCYHIKPGREPVQSKIVLNTGKVYSYKDLRVIIPRQDSQGAQLNTLDWHEFNRSFSLPIANQVPTYGCLTRADRDLIDNGTGEGDRNDRGFALAANLIATTDYLIEIGQSYEGDPRNLFERYCQNCSPPVENTEAESIWKSATMRATNTSLSAEQIKNCIKGWGWRQLRHEVPSQTEDGSLRPIRDDRAVNPTDRSTNKSEG